MIGGKVEGAAVSASRGFSITSCLPQPAVRLADSNAAVLSCARRQFRRISNHAAAMDLPPCFSLYETTGFRNTPIFSISHSTTSPGFRYNDFGSPLNAATPETVPVDSTSPAEYPIGE